IFSAGPASSPPTAMRGSRCSPACVKACDQLGSPPLALARPPMGQGQGSHAAARQRVAKIQQKEATRMSPTNPARAATARLSPAEQVATGSLERPIPSGANAPGFGSDVVAETLHALDIPYIALNPGASYRGLHDSIVNFLGNQKPQMLLCLHEEAAV